jgi:hypothetical protein
VQTDVQGLGLALRWLAESKHGPLVHVVGPIDERSRATLEAARSGGLVLLRCVRDANVAVPVSSAAGLDPMESFLVTDALGLDRVAAEGFALGFDGPGVPAARSAPSPAFLPHLARFGLASLPVSLAVERWSSAAALGPHVRVARARMLLDALEASVLDAQTDPIGGRLTRARLAIATGATSLVGAVVEPLLRSPGRPTHPFLCCETESVPEEDDDPIEWVERQALLATVLHAARSSFDAAESHRRLIERYFRLGGDHPEMNRRYGLLLALARGGPPPR